MSLFRNIFLVALLAVAQQTMAQFDSVDFVEFKDQFLIIYYDDLNREYAGSVVNFLEENYSRVMQEFGITELPKVTVHLWADYENLYAAQEERYGQRFQGSAGSVWWSEDGGPEILAIFDEKNEGRRDHTAGPLHEFVHILSIAINPTISNNPRWLWESVALYEAGQVRRGLSRIDYLVSGDYPTLEELDIGFNQANQSRNIYQFGYVISEYIVEMWGKEGLISLIQSNGDISSTLGISEFEFNAGWHTFMKEKYL